MIARRRPVKGLVVALVASALALAAPVTAQVSPQAVDALFSRFQAGDVPGCAVAVSQNHREVLARAYGMADLEHDVRNTPATVFEPGSVAKQFTATATILLALDGKISLDDDVRKYIPEIPDYGTPITIRHLLNHTSGLRDWGSVAAIGGWPRTTRVHTHRHVLDIVSHQTALNYKPGEYYSYTNTGYNLQVILVERVSGMSFSEFSKTRIFEPLGMTQTQWRDDFTRIVRDRAIAYAPGRDGEYHMNMPFENVYGNGGLLTTVGDMLRFTHNLETGELGGPRYIEEMHRQAVLNSGRTISYASGLMVGEYKGVREVQHSGATAGYRGYLTRFPDQGVAVAVMCNAANANVAAFAHQVADLYLGDAIVTMPAPPAAPTGVDVPAAQLQALAGTYRRARDGTPVVLRYADSALRLGNAPLTPLSPTTFVSAQGQRIEFGAAQAGGRPNAVVHLPAGDEMRLEPVPEFAPTADQMRQYVGAYHSDEAEATWYVELRDGGLFLADRYGNGGPLRPLYPDAFQGPIGGIVFHRDAGVVNGLSIVEGRVWDLRLAKVESQR